MRLIVLDHTVKCRRCRVVYPAQRRTCPCCNEYNPLYLAEPEGDYFNNDFSEEPEIDLVPPNPFQLF